MTQVISRIILTSAVIVALAIAGPVRAEDESPVKLKLYPMAAPTPALKYRLLYTYIDQIPGNAAVYYGKVKAEEERFFGNREFWNKMDDVWSEMPLEQLKSVDIQPRPSSWPIYFLEQGAKCKYCDWQLPIGREPFYAILLPEAQESRRYARMLRVKARWETAKGDFDAAIRTFRINYSMARNVAKGETLVNGLIGIAMCGIMFPVITEYVQQPDSPNLYWSLTTLPSPMISMNDALDVEAKALELSFPELRDLENAQHTPDEWREITHRIAAEVATAFARGNTPVQPKSAEDIDELCEKLVPIARESLVESGMRAEKVNLMPVHQLALLYAMSTCRQLFDEAAKCYSLPYPQAIEGIQAAKNLAKATDKTREFIPVVSPAMEALEATRSAVARCDRQIAFLRLIEALRIYGSTHGGRLPKQLSDVAEVPIPDDPATCKPFNYRRDGAKAFVESTAVLTYPFKYEIEMSRPK